MVRLWAIFLVMCAFIMRVSEITLFCPTFEHVRLPTDPRDWNDLGLPEFIELGLVQWKGRTNRSVYWMKLNRNVIDTKFCPVFWLMYWFVMAGLIDETKGPVFRKCVSLHCHPSHAPPTTPTTHTNTNLNISNHAP